MHIFGYLTIRTQVITFASLTQTKVLRSEKSTSTDLGMYINQTPRDTCKRYVTHGDTT